MRARARLSGPSHLALLTALTITVGAGLIVDLRAQAPGQADEAPATSWMPARLVDDQPDIQGMWNNTAAIFTPLELPEELLGRDDITTDELQQRAEARAKGRIESSEWKGHQNSRRGGKRSTANKKKGSGICRDMPGYSGI